MTLLQFPEFQTPCRAEEGLHRYFSHSSLVHSSDCCRHLVEVQAGYVVEVGLETCSATQTLFSTIEVVAEHDGQRVGVIGYPEEKNGMKVILLLHTLPQLLTEA